MINHVRTLLLNGPPGDLPSDEIVPSDYTPIALPVALAKVHAILFGPKPTRPVKNYRMRQLMVLLHITELESFVTLPDKRITYWKDGHLCTPLGRNTGLLPLPELIPALQHVLSEQDERVIFGGQPEQPYETFHALWRHQDQLAYKLGGLLLAVAYRTENLGAC